MVTTITAGADLTGGTDLDGRVTPELSEQIALVDRLRIPDGEWSAATARVPDGALAHLLWASIAINGGNRIAVPHIGRRG